MITIMTAETAVTAGGIVYLVMILMFIAVLISMLVKRIKLPYTVLLVVVGILLAIASRRIELLKELGSFKLTPDVIVYVLLPILLFESAFNMDSRRLLKNIVPVVVLAIPALLLSTVIVGGILFFSSTKWGIIESIPHDNPLIAALLFGALVSATDPVAVVSIFKELGAPKRLTILVEGESLFNDGTALVLFTIIAGILTGGAGGGEAAHGGLQIFLHGIEHFAVEAFGGILVGLLAGFIFSKILERIEEDTLIEITLTTLCAHSSFLLGEKFHVSGVIACVVAALTLGNYGRTKISPSVLEHMEHFWEYMAFAANSMVFLMVGLSLHSGDMVKHAGAIGIAIGACIVARAIGIFPLIPLVNRIQKEKIDSRYQTIMWWGGLRGALALVMALSLRKFLAGKLLSVEFCDFILYLTFGVVLFTIFVNATTMNWLIRILGFLKLTKAEKFERQEGLLLAKQKVRERLDSLFTNGVVSQKVFDTYYARYMQWEEKAKRELDEMKVGRESLTQELERDTMKRHCLMMEKLYYKEMFEGGDLDENIMKDLHHVIENQLDRLKEGKTILEEELGRKAFGRLEDKIVSLFIRVPGLGYLARRYKTNRLADYYEAARARIMAIDFVFGELEKVRKTKAMSDEAYDEIRDLYGKQKTMVKKRLKAISDIFPEFVEEVQNIFAARFCLKTEKEIFEDLFEKGMISDKVMKEMAHELTESIRALKAKPSEELLIKPETLLKKIPFFQDLNERQLRELARMLIPHSFLEGETVVKEGSSGDSMYLIGRGVVRVVTTSKETGGEVDLATLRAGNFFGEISLLTSKPRNASVITDTPCGLLELRRRDLHNFTRDYPEVDNALNKAYKERVLSTNLARVPLFAGLTNEERKMVAEALTPTYIREGEDICKAGEPEDALYIVKEGRVRITVAGERKAAYLEEGGFFGDAGIVSPSLSMATSSSVEGVDLLYIKRDELIRLLEEHPEVGEKISSAALETYRIQFPPLPEVTAPEVEAQAEEAEKAEAKEPPKEKPKAEEAPEEKAEAKEPPVEKPKAEEVPEEKAEAKEPPKEKPKAEEVPEEKAEAKEPPKEKPKAEEVPEEKAEAKEPPKKKPKKK
jgi:CPA1 family monovalent cation:H+ antiporter